MIKLLLILPILFEAINEGLYLRGRKVWSKQIQVLLIASWFMIFWQLDFSLDLIWIYILLRFALFNYIHNMAAGLPLNYIGTVSFVDRMLALACMGNMWMIYIAQAICLIAVYFML